MPAPQESSHQRKPDFFSLWPGLVFLLIPAGAITIHTIPGWWLAWILVTAMTGFTLPFIASFLLLLFAWSRYRKTGWRAALSILVLPAGIMASTMASDRVHVVADRISEPIQFRLFRSRLDALVLERQKEGKGSLAVLAVDGFGPMANGFAFDASDEILKPPGSQSPTWKGLAEHTELDRESWVAEKISGHYYRWFVQ